MLENNLNNISMQKQTFNMQLMDNENAINELSKTKNNAYKIIGTIMVNSNKEDLEKELKEQTEVLNLRIKNLEKQESSLKEKAEEIQKEVMKEIK